MPPASAVAKAAMQTATALTLSQFSDETVALATAPAAPPAPRPPVIVVVPDSAQAALRAGGAARIASVARSVASAAVVGTATAAPLARRTSNVRRRWRARPTRLRA